jgi:hypothetical protein
MTADGTSDPRRSHDGDIAPDLSTEGIKDLEVAAAAAVDRIGPLDPVLVGRAYNVYEAGERDSPEH